MRRHTGMRTATDQAVDTTALADLEFTPELPCEFHPAIYPAGTDVPVATLQVSTSGPCTCGQLGTFHLACLSCVDRLMGPCARVSHACGWWERGTRWVAAVQPLSLGDRCGA